MATIKTYLRTYSAPTLTKEPNADTFEELRDTLAYLKEKKKTLTIEHISPNSILLGCYCEDSKTFLRVDLTNMQI